MNMEIEKCKWKYGCQTAFMLMIDDLSNKYMTDKDDGNYLGADWGGKCYDKDSMYSFLKKNLLDLYPNLKVTFFLVVGRREDIIRNGKSNISHRIDEDTKFRDFISGLSRDDRIELAYHGMTHGAIQGGSFVQEWKLFENVEQAVEVINNAREIYSQVTGAEFKGGKYCGYATNDFSDDSVNKTKFTWWARHNETVLFKNRNEPGFSLELQKFNNIIDIPTTVDGNLFSIRSNKPFKIRNLLKSLRQIFFYRNSLEKNIRYLVEHQLLISVTEHTSPIREDQHRQFPNIVDDIENIKYILEYINKYDIWYATGCEIAEYYSLCECFEVYLEGDKIIAKLDGDNFIGKEVYVKINGYEDSQIWLERDNGEIILPQNGKKVFALKMDNVAQRYHICKGEIRGI